MGNGDGEKPGGAGRKILKRPGSGEQVLPVSLVIFSQIVDHHKISIFVIDN